MSTRSLRLCLSVLPLAALSIAACGEAPTRSGAGSSAASDATEGARVQAFLDARYTAKDVRHSFRTPAGQDIDCVDFFAEPGPRALAAEGHPMTELPKPAPVPERLRKRAQARGPRPEDALVFRGQPDASGRAMICPEGTVPEVRLTAEDIARRGGLDAYVASQSRKGGPVRSPATPPGAITDCSTLQSGEYANFAHSVGTLVMGQPGIDYAETAMAIYGPTVPTSEWVGNQLDIGGDHSLSELWLYSGSQTNVNGGTCTTADCVESIEVGWTVDPSAQVDPGNGSVPHLFIFATSDGYKTGCYNNKGNCGPRWFPMPGLSGEFVVDGVLAFDPPANTGGQDPQAGPMELDATVLLSGGQYQIWLLIGSQYLEIGYFLASDYSRPMDTVQVGGEVSDLTTKFVGTNVQMGSGYGAAVGFGWSAYHHDYIAIWPGGGVQEAATLCATRPDFYGVSTAPGPASSTWRDFFYYGGTPPATCTPRSCAAQGAACGTVFDGCGATESCGRCRIGFTCSANACVRRLLDHGAPVSSEAQDDSTVE